MPSKQIIHKTTIIDVKVSQPRSLSSTDNRKNFDYLKDATFISVDGDFYAFKVDTQSNTTTVKKFENFMDEKDIKITKLPSLPQFRENFALCIIESRYILLSGGTKRNELPSCSDVFMFDCEAGAWVDSPRP